MVVDVHMILEREDGRVLVIERANTGYADSRLVVPGGKLEPNEDVLSAAIREAREEVGVDIPAWAVKFSTVIQHEDRIGFFFWTSMWSEEPYNAEPEKCVGLQWINPGRPPAKLLGYNAAGLAAFKFRIPFTTYNPPR